MLAQAFEGFHKKTVRLLCAFFVKATTLCVYLANKLYSFIFLLYLFQDCLEIIFAVNAPIIKISYCASSIVYSLVFTDFSSFPLDFVKESFCKI